MKYNDDMLQYRPSARTCRNLRITLGAGAGIAIFLVLVYLYQYTPLLVYFLDKLNLRPFFLPNILCNNCTQINYGFLINNESLCHDDIFLLNVVISFHANVRSRTVIRKTWGGVKDYKGQKVKTIFAFGIHEDKNFNKQLVLENQEHEDILQIDIMDKYRSLTEKTITVMKWFHKYCKNAKYILKTDDDSFNYIPRIMDYLLGVKQEKFVGGYCFTVTPDRRKGSKYYVAEISYPDSYYPTYCAGPGYIMSQGAVGDILDIHQNVIYLPMEDVYIAGLCREAAQIKYTEIPGMIVGEPQLTPCDLATWAKNTHNVVPERMQQLWDRAIRANTAKDCINRNFKRFIWMIVALVIWIKLITVMLRR